MAEIAKSGIPSLSSLLPNGADNLSGLIAGEEIDAFDACYVKQSDNRVYKSTGAAANAAAKVRGYAQFPSKVGEAVTLLKNVRARYASDLSALVGSNVFLSGTVPGGLADAASTGGASPIGFVVDKTRIQLNASNY